MELPLVVNSGAAVSTEQAEDSVVRHACGWGISGICPAVQWMFAWEIATRCRSRTTDVGNGDNAAACSIAASYRDRSKVLPQGSSLLQETVLCDNQIATMPHFGSTTSATCRRLILHSGEDGRKEVELSKELLCKKKHRNSDPFPKVRSDWFRWRWTDFYGSVGK
jgi:hypothetical protein